MRFFLVLGDLIVNMNIECGYVADVDSPPIHCTCNPLVSSNTIIFSLIFIRMSADMLLMLILLLYIVLVILLFLQTQLFFLSFLFAWNPNKGVISPRFGGDLNLDIKWVQYILVKLATSLISVTAKALFCHCY